MVTIIHNRKSIGTYLVPTNNVQEKKIIRTAVTVVQLYQLHFNHNVTLPRVMQITE